MHLLALIVSLLSVATLASDNGLMRTPPMGWLAWERFRCDTDCEHDPLNCIRQGNMLQMTVMPCLYVLEDSQNYFFLLLVNGS